MVRTTDIVRVDRRSVHEGVGRDGSRARRRFGVRAGRARREKHQDRLCQPADRAARGLRRSRRLHHRSFSRRRKPAQVGSATFRSSRRQGQPVQPQPRRRGREGTDRRRRDQPDARRLDARDDQPGVHHLRDRGDALHLDRRAVAALVHRPAGQSRRSRPPGSRSTTPTTSSGASRTSSPSSPTCGTSSTPTRRSAALFPNDGDGNAWGDPKVGFPPVLEQARLHPHRSRPLPEPHRRLLAPRSTPSRRRTARSSPAW